MKTNDECANAGSRDFEREILKFMPQDIRDLILRIDPKSLESLEEIRLRADKPLMLQNRYGDWFVDRNGKLASDYKSSRLVSQNEIIKTVELMSENSIYAYQDEIKNGFITLKGGHRVGIVGRVVLDGYGIKNIKDISALNVRVSREIIGCSERVLKHIIKGDIDIFNTLIISPPQCGKTTMLRDMARSLSDGIPALKFKGVKVGVIDERSEIGACFKGVAQNRLGARTDVLDGCPKSIGMTLILRSMSPQVIITDEIGNSGDKEAVMQVINAGVKIITSAHGYNISELKARREVIGLIEQRIFERYIVLSNSNGPGTVKEVIDGIAMKAIEEGDDAA